MITFNNVIPAPLASNTLSLSNIWATDCVFEQNNNYLVAAPSGKGKSTFLHIIYGLRNDYQGDITIHSKNVQENSTDDWATIRQTQLSLVFQDLRLFPTLSSHENLLLTSQMNPDFISEDDIHEMAKQLDVEHLLNQPTSSLSYGQRQRFAIIRALCQPFQYLLLDEPFSHLDNANIEKASQLIDDHCKKQQAGIILVSLGDAYLFDYQKELTL